MNECNQKVMNEFAEWPCLLSMYHCTVGFKRNLLMEIKPGAYEAVLLSHQEGWGMPPAPRKC